MCIRDRSKLCPNTAPIIAPSGPPSKKPKLPPSSFPQIAIYRLLLLEHYLNTPIRKLSGQLQLTSHATNCTLHCRLSEPGQPSSVINSHFPARGCLKHLNTPHCEPMNPCRWMADWITPPGRLPRNQRPFAILSMPALACMTPVSQCCGMTTISTSPIGLKSPWLVRFKPRGIL